MLTLNQFPTDEELINTYGITREHLRDLRAGERAQAIVDACKITFCTNSDGQIALLKPQAEREDYDPFDPKQVGIHPIIRADVVTEMGNLRIDVPMSYEAFIRHNNLNIFLDWIVRRHAYHHIKQTIL
jgi:hypothetical protein